MLIRGAAAEQAVVRQATGFVRCLCPTCLGLDARYPAEGYQLAFWPYRLDLRNGRK